MEDNYKTFLEALKVVLKHEGGLVDNPNDPGGITNYGISLRTLTRSGPIDLVDDCISDYDFNGDGAIDRLDIIDIDEAGVRLFYHAEFWQQYAYGKLPFNVAVKVFDLSVNMGPRQAHLILQRALMANGHSLIDDGIIGNITRTLIKVTDEPSLLAAIRSEAAGFYRLLTSNNPNLQEFLKGWLRRAYS